MSTVLLAVGLLVVLLLAQPVLRALRPLPSAPAPTHTDASTVAVVVPARDEAATLPALLTSLQALATPPAEVVVVDDGSRDGTAAVARGLGATVVEVDGPPPGWTGKAWACHTGARATTADRLLFLDADTWLAPGALDEVLALHADRGGLVSVQPFHEVREPYEQLSAYFNVVSLMASAPIGPRSGAMAFGPCLLTTRADYERAGGHEAVRAEILDDVQLAAAYRRAGLPVSCATGGGAVRMRMYPGGWRQLAEGWTKNFASGASASAPLPTLVAVLWIAAHHAVAVGTVLAATGSSLASGPLPFWLAAWVAVAGQLWSVLRRTGSFRWWTWALFPVPLLAFDWLFARSVLLTAVRRSVRWRGRDVSLARASSATEAEDA